MYVIRPITSADATIIAHHRKQMFLDMGRPDDSNMTTMLEVFGSWVRSAIARGLYGGFLAELQGQAVAGLGMMFQEYPPRPGDSSCARGYIFNVYTEPPHRRKGLAKRLMEAALSECKARGLEMVTLHASEMGLSLYETLGFEQSNEMIIRRLSQRKT